MKGSHEVCDDSLGFDHRADDGDTPVAHGFEHRGSRCFSQHSAPSGLLRYLLHHDQIQRSIPPDAKTPYLSGLLASVSDDSHLLTVHLLLDLKADPNSTMVHLRN
mmetsp:Transcript_34653/g.55900  ORF Transcript_34653/g.55900 Transcript_34653/m.55900 type:complete len:105 (+) Transcript_34653:1142-1456(+)